MGIEIIGAPPGLVQRSKTRAGPHSANPVRRAMGYVRISKDAGERAISPAAQERIIRKYCAEHAIPLADEDIIHERKSGATLSNRPGLLYVLELAEKRKISHVVVQDITRAFRSTIEGLTVLEMLDARGVSLRSVVRHIDISTADGEFSATMDLALGRRERRVIGERTSRALRAAKQAQHGTGNPAVEAKARNGKLLVGKAPYGYRWGPKGAEKKRLMEHPVEITHVMEILRLHGEGVSVAEILVHLNAMNAFNRAGVPFDRKAVHRILSRGTEAAG